MQLADLIIERSNLLKRQAYWKMAVLFCIIAIIYLSYSKILPGSNNPVIKDSSYIGTIKIENEIFEDSKFDKMLDDIYKDKNLKALIVQINSPGGSSGASEKIYNKILTIKKTKPVVATISSLGASGAYLIALAAERIYALNMSITGSIGVIVQSADLINLAEKLGIKFKTYKSSPLKASPSPFEKASPEAEAALMDVVLDSHEFFIDTVALNRNLDKETARKLSDGRIYSGRQALKLNLIDQIGDIENAKQWLIDNKKLSPNLQIRELEPKKHSEFLDILINRLDESSKSFIQKISMKLI